MYDNIIENLQRFQISAGLGCILAHSMGCGKTVQVKPRQKKNSFSSLISFSIRLSHLSISYYNTQLQN
jgi:hypothetical protein